MTEVTLKFVCLGDETEAIRIATSISEYIQGGVDIVRPDGTKNTIIALPTAAYQLVARGPADPPNDPMPYEDFGA